MSGRQSTAIAFVSILILTTALRGTVGTAGMDRRTMQLKSEFDFGFEQGHTAANLARGNGYSVKFPDSPPLPSAWASPLYPLLLAGIFQIWGVYTFESQIAVIWLNAFFHGAIAALLFLLARRSTRAIEPPNSLPLLNQAHGPQSVGARTKFPNATPLLAVLLFLFLPSGWQFLHWAWCTHLLAALILLHLWTLTRDWRSLLAMAAGSGATLALAMLADGAAVMLAPISIWQLWRTSRTITHNHPAPAQFTTNSLAFITAALLILSPWIIRNGLTLGSWSPLRGMLGTALWMGNHPGAADENYLGLSENPWHNPAAAKRFVALGEAGFDTDNRTRFIAAVRADPPRFIKSCAMRLSGFWFGQWWTGWANYPRIYSAGLILTTLLAAAGIRKSLQLRLPVAVYMGVMLLYPLPYYATFLAYGRYRYPIEPVLCLLAAVLLTSRVRPPRDIVRA